MTIMTKLQVFVYMCSFIVCLTLPSQNSMKFVTYSTRTYTCIRAHIINVHVPLDIFPLQSLPVSVAPHTQYPASRSAGSR